MTVTYLSTEDPEEEQWNLLSQFSYPTNIRDYLLENEYSPDDEIVDLIAGSMRQAEAFFSSARGAPIDVSPLLLYYGAQNLLTGVSALLTNVVLPIRSHGMSISQSEAERIADVSIIPQHREIGALQAYCNVFSDTCMITNGGTWTMLELLGSIPDLIQDFKNHYKEERHYVIPVEKARTRERYFERISNADLTSYSEPAEAFANIVGFQEAYLPPQHKAEHVILNYRPGGKSIGTYSITGKKYLQIAHIKNGRPISPDQLILMFMGLFVLGSLPRYRPQLWNPFVRSDQSGEKFIVEKFLRICRRAVPNLVLNAIRDTVIVFVNRPDALLYLD